MKGNIIAVATAFIAILAVITAFICENIRITETEDNYGSLAVAANEIEQLILNGETALAAERAEALRTDLSSIPAVPHNTSRYVWLIFGFSSLVIAASFVYIWFAVLRPFKKLEKYAESIAAGNFDIPLDFERTNYFGKFTWAFDNMRREIIKARACEKEAIENNKTIIATLSHDIKTPIASIRAYTEGLEAGLDSTAEKRQKYLSVIMNKCDEVARLTNDMFLHSLSDLEKLKMNPEIFDLCEFLQTVSAEYEDVKTESPCFSGNVNADKNRLGQIIGNIITNAKKYAKTEVHISFSCDNDNINVHFRDFGNGIPDEDIPFIFGKFYRGKNCGSEQGAGLGLYIVKYVMEQSGGSVSLKNQDKGLEVTISLPIYNK